MYVRRIASSSGLLSVFFLFNRTFFLNFAPFMYGRLDASLKEVWSKNQTASICLKII